MQEDSERPKPIESDQECDVVLTLPDFEGDSDHEGDPLSAEIKVEGHNFEEDHGQPLNALQMIRERESKKHSPVALGLGVLSRGIATVCGSFEEIASIADLFLTYTPSYLILKYTRIFILLMLIGVIFFGVGSTAVTWGFWMPPVQDYTASAVDWIRARCGFPNQPKQLLVESDEEAGCTDQVVVSKPWLTYVTTSCSVATLALVANEVEESTRIMFGQQSLTWYTGALGLGAGIIASVYSGFTDLDSLWQARWQSTEITTVRRPPSEAIYVPTGLGTLELFFRSWFTIYLSWLELYDNRAAGFFIASFFTICGTIQNFCFQTSYALEGSAFLRSVRSMVFNLPLLVKIPFLGLIGLTTVVVNMSMTTFNMRTLLPVILLFMGITISPSVATIIALVTAAGVTWGDLISSFWGGVVQLAMGRDQPDNLYLHNSPGPRAFRMGFSYRENQGRGPAMFAPGVPRVEILSSEDESNADAEFPQDQETGRVLEEWQGYLPTSVGSNGVD